ncbi:hypothetical protein Hokovirus_2_132 [Hokovirus HKV1]|uniref:Uncharacterized protein n=1 Tax=Hokovirus HKV1 TaxID=1977638 RepID=A0A1V0SFW1_9VIRU|nr:hypothetical protein Hokovirus_2_132 [Hokovirus HKV1]
MICINHIIINLKYQIKIIYYLLFVILDLLLLMMICINHIIINLKYQIKIIYYLLFVILFFINFNYLNYFIYFVSDYFCFFYNSSL